MSVVFWDTNLFIFFLEGAIPEATKVRELKERMRERGDQLVTSTLTLAETQVKPLERGNARLAEEYEALLRSQTRVIPFDHVAAGHFARIRAADLSIKPPDAIQLACGLAGGTEIFITHDEHLSRKRISGISFVVPLEKAYNFFT